MSYSVDELFKFEETEGGYSLVEYLKKGDPEITELKLPEEYNDEPVTAVGGFAYSTYLKRVVIPPSVRVLDLQCFNKCEQLEAVELSEGLEIIEHGAFSGAGLKSVVLPKSLKRLRNCAFIYCRELESVIFNSKPDFGIWVFDDCPKLPAEYALMNLIHSSDISEPFDTGEYNTIFEYETKDRFDYIRPDVLELAAKNNCFRSVDKFVLLKFIIDEENAESLRAAGENGIFDTRELLDRCVEYSAEQGKTESTAYLLDLKNRKFGFDGFGGENNVEL